MQTLGHWIGGKHTEPASGAHAPVFDPARGTQRARLGLADEIEVDAAVAAAHAAYPAWSASSVARRTAFLYAYRELLAAHREELAALVTAEHGKVHADALGELARGLEVVELACNAPELLKGELTTEASTGIDVATLRRPLGVVAGITPFNFPAMVPLWMFPLALACGNTFVLKPSEKDPSASLRLADAAELLSRSGHGALPARDETGAVASGDAGAVMTDLFGGLG